MNNDLNYLMKILLHNWLNGDIIADFYLFKAFVFIGKLSNNIYKN